MKIDPDLIRNLLQAIEDIPAENLPVQQLQVDQGKKSIFDVCAHLKQMIRSGYIEGDVGSDEQGRPAYFSIDGLTIEGQDFLANAKIPVAWEKAMSAVKSLGGGVALEVLKSLLAKEAIDLVRKAAF